MHELKKKKIKKRNWDYVWGEASIPLVSLLHLFLLLFLLLLTAGFRLHIHQTSLHLSHPRFLQCKITITFTHAFHTVKPSLCGNWLHMSKREVLLKISRHTHFNAKYCLFLQKEYLKKVHKSQQKGDHKTVRFWQSGVSFSNVNIMLSKKKTYIISHYKIPYIIISYIHWYLFLVAISHTGNNGFYTQLSISTYRLFIQLNISYIDLFFSIAEI